MIPGNRPPEKRGQSLRGQERRRDGARAGRLVGRVGMDGVGEHRAGEPRRSPKGRRPLEHDRGEGGVGRRRRATPLARFCLTVRRSRRRSVRDRGSWAAPAARARTGPASCFSGDGGTSQSPPHALERSRRVRVRVSVALWARGRRLDVRSKPSLGPTVRRERAAPEFGLDDH